MAVGRHFVCTSSFLLSRLLTSRCFSFSFEQHCKKKDSCMHDTTVLFIFQPCASLTLLSMGSSMPDVLYDQIVDSIIT